MTCSALGPLRAQTQVLPVWSHSDDHCDDDIREEGSMKSSCYKMTADVSSAPVPSAAGRGGHILEGGGTMLCKLCLHSGPPRPR